MEIHNDKFWYKIFQVISFFLSLSLGCFRTETRVSSFLKRLLGAYAESTPGAADLRPACTYDPQLRKQTPCTLVRAPALRSFCFALLSPRVVSNVSALVVVRKTASGIACAFRLPTILKISKILRPLSDRFVFGPLSWISAYFVICCTRTFFFYIFMFIFRRKINAII